MSSIHCNKFLLQNVFKTLFISKPAITTFGKRRIATTAIPKKLVDYNRSIKTHALTFKKKESSQREAIKVLQEMKLKHIEPNSQTWLHLVIGMSFQRHRNNFQNQRLEEWFNNLLVSVKDKHRQASILDKFKKVIFHLSLHGHPKLLEMFLQMNSMIPLSVEYWHLAMKGCIKSRNIQDAETLFDLLREKTMATKTSYEILIESYLFLKDQASASKIFSVMLQDKMTANYDTYQLFIQYYMHLPYSTEHAETLFKLWQACLLTTTANNKLSDAMIYQYLSYFGGNGELTKAEQIYLDVKPRILDRKCFGALNKLVISSCQRKHLLSALSLYYDLLAQGYKPSKYVIDKITKLCIERHDTEAIKQLIEITQHHCQQ
ncbi:hypothetical protein EDC94DRAFT_698149 [Helicostylum pulchrum]|uniref:Pentatricopeptide repeat-containing protein n=1 Tax=Helicostylum pulchrum TaxID=562976 RepID=A0ABP9XSD1_9FUNG|nr:hypothetical protein EDC94DRAFT_698149 [Helicostylum pulchrum]